MQETVLIPKDRVAILIGRKGTSRRQIEKLGGVKLWVDSNSSEITLNGSNLNRIYFTKKVVELVARGFSPKSACKLFDEKYAAEILELRDFNAKERKDRKRILGRLIGTQGKTKNIIEKDTNTEIIIYGKTVSILGKTEDVEHARLAVESLLGGSKFGRAFRALKE
jgi:ribosomal RNA assembly protein